MNSRPQWAIALVAVLVWIPVAVGDASEQSLPCGPGSAWFMPDADEEGGVGGSGVRGDEDGGVGGTGIRGDDDGGVGGSGVRARIDEDGGVGGSGVRARIDEDGGVGGSGVRGDEDGGVGGTGVRGDEDGGVGGTGIGIAADGGRRIGFFGRITAFGSICINGVQVAYDSTVGVDVDGEVSGSNALALGHVVAIDATERGDGVVATHVNVHFALAGPITALDAAGEQLEVMGQPVELGVDAIVHTSALDKPGPATLVLSDLNVDDYVRVSGLRTSDDRVIASRLDRVPTRPTVSVTGMLRSDTDRIAVGGIGIESDAEIPDVEPDTRYAAATGVWDPAAGVIDDALLIPALDRMTGAEHVVLEGYVQERLDTNAWRVAGFTVLPGNAETADFEVDALVRVSASVDDVGGLAADRIEFFDPDRLPLRPLAGTESRERGRPDNRGGEEREDGGDDAEFDDGESGLDDGNDEDFEAESPESHGTEADEYDAPESEAPEYEAPESPEYEAPESPEFEAPEVPETETPEIPEFDPPETPEIPEFDPPETPEFDLPETPEFDPPEIPEFDPPEIPEFDPPEIPEIGPPEIPEIDPHESG